MQVNVSGTREFYHSITESSLCDCGYCRNYRLQVKSAFPMSLCIWILWAFHQKPLETSPLEPDENGMLEYCCCQYIALGSCEPEYHHKIADIEFRAATSYPSTGIEQAHFVLEFSPIKLKYIR